MAEGCGLCFGLLLYLGALAFVIITCVLIAESGDTVDACGHIMWTVLLLRVCLFGVALLQACCVMWDAESYMRSCIGAQRLAADDEGGLCQMLFGNSDGVRWASAFLSFLCHCGFLVALAIGLSEATHAGDACLLALSTASFTGTYTLIAIGWIWLVGDALAVLTLGVKLTRTRRDLGTTGVFI